MSKYSKNPPTYFSDPVTGNLMNDPVVTKDVCSYERSMCKYKDVFPNLTLKNSIDEWKKAHSTSTSQEETYPFDPKKASTFDMVLYFRVKGGLEARNTIHNHLSAFGFDWMDMTGGQGAFHDGDFALFCQEVRACANKQRFTLQELFRMPYPGLGLCLTQDILLAMQEDGLLEFGVCTGEEYQ